MVDENNSHSGIWIERSLFESSAFFALGGVAVQLLIVLMAKLTFEDTISCSLIEECEKYDITRSRFKRAVSDLLKKGFIAVEHQGGGGRSDRTRYRLSSDWRTCGR